VPQEMTSLQRVKAVLSGAPADRVPVCLLSFQNAAHLAGYGIDEYCLDGDKMAAAQLAYWEVFQHDIIDIENGVAAMAEAVGCEVAYTRDAPPWVTRPAISSLAEVDSLPDVDPLRSPGLSALLRATQIVAGALGDRVCVRGESDQGPFNLAAEILGMERFLLALTEPEQAAGLHRLLSYAAAQVEKLARAQIAAGSHFTLIGESTAGPDVCSPATYRRFALPYEQGLVKTLRREGVEVGIHMCGNATRIIPDMLSTSALYFELDAKIDRSAVRRATEGRVTIFGTVDPGQLLPCGTADEVAAAARNDIRLLGQNGRYVLTPGCTLPFDTPVENVRALVATAREYGCYRADGKLASASDAAI
jgi:uroporphyrinogen decarboxylase